jgi:hypothetical protein
MLSGKILAFFCPQLMPLKKKYDHFVVAVLTSLYKIKWG